MGLLESWQDYSLDISGIYTVRQRERNKLIEDLGRRNVPEESEQAITELKEFDQYTQDQLTAVSTGLGAQKIQEQIVPQPVTGDLSYLTEKLGRPVMAWEAQMLLKELPDGTRNRI